MLVSSQSTPTATDSDCWPEVLAAPSGPVAAASAVFADRLLRRAVAGLPMRVAYPDGTVIGAGDASSPTLTVNDPDRLARRMGRHGLVGFGESYMAGEWESTELVAVLIVIAPALNHLVPRRDVHRYFLAAKQSEFAVGSATGQLLRIGRFGRMHSLLSLFREPRATGKPLVRREMEAALRRR